MAIFARLRHIVLPQQKRGVPSVCTVARNILPDHQTHAMTLPFVSRQEVPNEGGCETESHRARLRRTDDSGDRLGI